MNEFQRNSFGRSFSPPAVFAGYALLGSGVLMLISAPLVGLIGVVLGGFFAFTAYGVEIDLATGRFREYASYYGFRVGEWESFDTYRVLSVLKVSKSFTAFSMSNRSISDVEYYYDVHLLDESHRVKRPIERCDTKKEALEAANKLSGVLALPVVVYNPKVSAKTKARR